VFSGVRVLEVAQWTFAPAAAGVLADFGADVIKIEDPRTGDPQRGLATAGVSPVVGGVNLVHAQTNRGKRSLGLDLRTARGQEILGKLVAASDVFLTNFLRPARQKLKLEPEDIRALNPRIVYARATGQGPEGPDADQGGYDLTSYWLRSGINSALTHPEAGHFVMQPPAFGDKVGAMNLAFGIAAGLFHRERTGSGTVVDVSLLATALWQNSSAMTYTVGLGREHPIQQRRRTNPLVHAYRTADKRWLCFSMLESDRYWPDLCAHLGRPDLADDERFRDAAARTRNVAACVAELTALLGSQTLDHWRQRFATLQGPWAPGQTMLEAATDPQVEANGYLTTLSDEAGQPAGTVVASPASFDGARPALRRAPEHAEHTEEVLLSLGYDWDDITALRDDGVI
jgi:crotonobetainyl-CoA:carnitine CoA-transferase CaiB-like acyl-CoA transferase